MDKAKTSDKLAVKLVEFITPNFNAPPIIAQVNKPLAESRVALVTSAGVHTKSQEKYDTKIGDHTYRIIPDDIPMSELMITHGHYDQSEAEKDINCVFPLERLHELRDEGFIGSTASNHFGFMGFIPIMAKLINESAPEVARKLKEDNVDIVILSPA